MRSKVQDHKTLILPVILKIKPQRKWIQCFKNVGCSKHPGLVNQWAAAFCTEAHKIPLAHRMS